MDLVCAARGAIYYRWWGLKRLSFDPAAETGAARNIALLWNLNAIEITD
jgi:hypothetical protein